MEEKKSISSQISETKDRHETAVEKALSKNVSHSARVNAMIHWAALGLSKKQIAEKMGISQSRVHAVLGSSSAKAEIERLQTEMWFEDPKRMFRKDIPSAVKVVRTIMKDKNEKASSRLQAADMMMDRTYGKTTQTIEHQGSAIKDLLMAMDKMNRAPEVKALSGDGSEPIEAEFKAVEPKKDEMQSWIDDNL